MRSFPLPPLLAVALFCALTASAQDLERADERAGDLARRMAAVAAPGKPVARPKDEVVFYFVGHEDDWQLFMNPPAFNDVVDTEEPARPMREAVFVHLTAGDAGDGAEPNGANPPYYLARENGARLAIRFMSDAKPGRVAEGSKEEFVALDGHKVFRVGYRNTAAYFLRLPDGGVDGAGYDRTGRQSLKRLQEGKIATLTALDGSTAYSGWTDLAATVRALIDRERAGSTHVSLNVSEIDERLNPGDHPDHRAAAELALEAASGQRCARRVFHQTYHVADEPANLSREEHEMQAAVFAVTAAGVTALGSANTWEPHYKVWLGRGYSRAVEPPADCR